MKTLLELSHHAAEVDLITTMLLVLSSILVAAVWIAVIYFCWKYHVSRKPDRTRPPTQARKIELILCSMIFCFGLATFIWSARQYYRLYLAPAEAHTIYVIGKQWMWTFHDPEHGDAINRMTVPVGQPVRLVMTSEDVIHSFFIPNLRIKQDVLPGRYTSLWFTPEQTGEYEVLCTQYCGLEHSMMSAVLAVVDRDKFISHEEKNPGAEAFQKFGCVSCHAGGSKIAPSLDGIFGKTVRLNGGRVVKIDENYLRRSVLDPNSEVVEGYAASMPTYKGQLTETELVSLIGYIKSLGVTKR